MELKLQTLTRQRISALGFNRTFMELKQKRRSGGGGRAASFNRTFMELKLISIFGKQVVTVF